ncbi:hypothetical protein HFK74_07725|uniref:hypothetical protein n=1 Tax=Pseudomonas sp. SbOxS1 TaxID=2723884 RepID=UPI0015D125C1|nr:hypothetical protein [Pseudomonas sp. SbOxS1]NYU02585.1 hypothetical protein [Pseudomonas sp. SbOxS1]
MPIQIRWSGETDLKIPIPFDTENLLIVDDLMDYAIHLQRNECWSFTYVKNEMYHLVLYFNYIESERISITSATNSTLRNFRDEDLKRLKAKSSVVEKKLKRVVNSRLTIIYCFYHWYQSRHKLCGFIGAHECAITSDFTLKAKKNKSSEGYHRMYPLNYRRIGRSSKHATEYSATEEDVSKLEDYFRKERNKYISERNSLMMAIAGTVGFRRGSINSLRCSQFSQEELGKNLDDYIIVNPDKQKFDANLNYRIPILLAYRISEFITTVRKSMLKEKGFNEAVTLDRVFLSMRTGQPLNDTSVSDIFGKAFRAIGNTQARTSIHAFRRMFAEHRIQTNFEQRAELRLDTSDASVSASVAMDLGQRNPDSIKPYVARTQQTLVNKRYKEKNEIIKKLNEENFRLQSELDDLKEKIKNS